MEIAVIGKSDFVVGFKLAGIRKTYDVRDEKEMEEKVRQCMGDRNLGIIVLYADDVRKMSLAMQKTVDESVEPTFIAIGGREESGLRDKIRRAIGVDLWK
jgi:V/A-type H+/Na+-transporting ATPase subunit F